MKTIVYMVRHAESPYTEGTERTRGLTLEGKMNAERITEILTNEGIHAIVSSPYARAILTLEGVAAALELDIQIMEDLRERHFSDDMIADEEFEPASKRMFDDPDYALPGGESNTVCQNRAVGVLKQILEEYKGKKVAIGIRPRSGTKLEEDSERHANSKEAESAVVNTRRLFNSSHLSV
ncbi:histidine phosphatase family protein [Paenibacillus sp. FSL R5-0766]|uniref:histidine phosphatase family protein n=1 Tax=unclassified Paenibacillus TaxID=185978 RepID=UPI00211697AC|nr:histidine phosphatase family protein [Paenibacillus sp. FSL R5-0765]